MYTATEGVDASVELCAVLVTGILERQTIVMFSTSDGTATSLGMSMFVLIYPMNALDLVHTIVSLIWPYQL